MLEIILKIAIGIYYMHDIKITYYNLKFTKINLDLINILKMVEKTYVHVKFLDLDISKFEVKISLQVLIKRRTIGTI